MMDAFDILGIKPTSSTKEITTSTTATPIVAAGTIILGK